MNTDFASILDNLAEVDWKGESQDILYAVRESYKVSYSALLEKSLDELAENYAAEPTDDFINAFGQELSTLDLLLYEIDTDSDSYMLAIIPIESEDEWKAFLKQHKKKGRARKQPRRKLGTDAKRIDLGKRLPCDKFSLPEGYRPDLVTECFDDTMWLDYSQFRAPRKFDTATLDIGTWPPVQGQDLGLCLNRATRNEDGTYAAIVSNNTLNEQGYLSDKNKKVLIGQDVSSVKDWNCIYQGTDFDWSAMIWYENELFVSDQTSVYHIKNLEKFSDSMEKVLEQSDSDRGQRRYPEFFVLDDTLYLYLLQSIYKWEKKRSLFKRGYAFRKIYTLEGFSAENFVPVGDHRVAFQTRPEYIPRGATEAELTVLDIHTFQIEKHPCHYGYVRKWTENRVCVFPINVTSNMPIMECFDFDTQEIRCLKFGALGSECLHNIYETKCGTILKGSGYDFYKADDLWNFMESTRVSF